MAGPEKVAALLSSSPESACDNSVVSARQGSILYSIRGAANAGNVKRLEMNSGNNQEPPPPADSVTLLGTVSPPGMISVSLIGTKDINSSSGAFLAGW